MTAFKQLKDVSNAFEQQLRDISTELFSAKIQEPFEEGLTNKLQDLTFLTSKLRLLKAKPLSALPQITERTKTEETIKEYGELAQWKVLEQSIVKSLTQAHAVKALLTTPDRNLEPDLVERKEQITTALKEFRHQESQLRHLKSLEAEKEAELAAARSLWDQELTQLRDMRESGNYFEEYDVTSPMYKKLRTVVDKLELMRWLVGRLVTSRGSRDWLATPDRTAHLLRLATKHNNVDTFLKD
ncbi:uncharacterized protein LOC118281156 [Spodoptera frugiperda]|uniref:Uncharacterized protein LOC118281156 n=1 Tax=Spodoptera frugiperda TaxID=7108 RepID=A0A9R0E182_SPOFR|nr:uncharacterized protein LOC118281156 [Spodoptera frugiperda]